MSDTDFSEAPPTGHERSTTHRLAPSYIPGRLFWVLVVLYAAAVTIARVINDDRSIVNLTMLIGGALCSLALLAWFLLRSAYPRLYRILVALAVLGTLCYLASQYRLVRFSGAMFPEFGRRLPAIDTELAPLRPHGSADLDSTTPQDFPQFLGPDRTAALAQLSLAKDWQQDPPVEKWRRSIGAGWSAFAVVNGYAVTMEQRGDDELVSCYRATDGQPVWSNAVKARHASALGFVGPRSTPTIQNGRVFAMGATAILRCLRGEDGHTLWQRSLYEDLGVSQEEAEEHVPWGRANSPLVVDNKVIVPWGGGERPVSLIALDADSGATIWQAGSHQVSYASPVLATLQGRRQILSVNENFVTAYDLESGDILWEHDWPGLSCMDASCSQPVPVDDDRVFLSKGYSTGAELLEIQEGQPWSVRSLWKAKVMKTKFSNVMIRDGFVYGLDDGILSCIELQTGKRRWKKGRFGYGQNLMVGDLIIVLAENGDLALVAADPDRFVQLAHIPALSGQTWNNPALYGDLLLIRNSEHAACFQLKLQ